MPSKQWKLEYFGHLMRNKNYFLLQNIMQEKINGKYESGAEFRGWRIYGNGTDTVHLFSRNSLIKFKSCWSSPTFKISMVLKEEAIEIIEKNTVLSRENTRTIWSLWGRCGVRLFCQLHSEIKKKINIRTLTIKNIVCERLCF